MKTRHPAWIDRIKNAPTPGQAKRIGREAPLRPNWDAVKISVMLNILRAKFGQNETLADKLVATYPRELVEGNTWGDRFWGVDPPPHPPARAGWGDNWLGRLLMVVRSELIAIR